MDPNFWNSSTFERTYRVLCSTALLENEPVRTESEQWLPDGLTFDLRPSSEYNTLTRPQRQYEPMEVDPVDEPFSFNVPWLRDPVDEPFGFNVPWLQENGCDAPDPTGPVGFVRQLRSSAPLLRPSQLKWQTV
jgi:hypothetical protein